MTPKDYAEMPGHVTKRMQEYLDHARQMAVSALGQDRVDADPMITIQIASSMMAYDAAIVQDSTQQKIANALEAK